MKREVVLRFHIKKTVPVQYIRRSIAPKLVEHSPISTNISSYCECSAKT
ncbi:MAG: hypothetical protein OSJ43_09575 [Oscillospiraceae bacterium]|nr:hypothetical protein [Oscillospiraceae bacterium]